MTDWISVKDRLPYVGKEVLVGILFDDGYWFQTIASFTGTKFEDNGEWKFNTDEGDEMMPTHWIPIPEPPKE
jgi:hypothetical protein